MTDTIISVIDSFTSLFSPFEITLLSSISPDNPSLLQLIFNSEKLESPSLILALNSSKSELTVEKPGRHAPSNALHNRLEKEGTTFKVTQLYDFMERLLSILPTLRDHCVICGVLVDVQPDCYISCGNGECRFRSEELMLDNRVTESVKANPVVARLMLDLAYKSMISSRREMVFEPFPYCLLKSDVTMKRGHLTAIDGGNLNEYKDFEAVDKLAEQIRGKCGKLITVCNTAKDDHDIVDQIGFELYRFIRFVLISVDADIQPDTICGLKAHVKCYRVFHKIEKEEEYKRVIGGDTRYLYHGSNSDCWYSIIRNGLKVASNTKMMFNGASVGNGVYTAANYMTSVNYAGAKNPKIIGVFEVSNNRKYYSHDSSVCVINASEALILRYLLIHETETVAEEIDKVFASRLKAVKKEKMKMMTSKATRRLIKEFEMMQKSDVTDTLGFVTEIEDGGDDLTKWRVKMLRSGFDSKERITKTMESLGIYAVELEIHFPERYPFAPPFVRIVRPRFQYRTGHITIGGAICHELLSMKKWKPICKVESLLVDIRCNIFEGEGDIDFGKWNIPYNLSEAKSDYVRVMNAHGWN